MSQPQLPFEFAITNAEILIRIDRRHNVNARDTIVLVQNACDAVVRELSEEVSDPNKSSETSGSFECFSDCSCLLDSDSDAEWCYHYAPA